MGELTRIDNAAIRSAAMTLRAVDNRFRQQILKLLAENSRMIVSDIFVKLRTEQSITSQHLGILRQANVVITERDGKFIRYSLNPRRLDALATFTEKIASDLGEN